MSRIDSSTCGSTDGGTDDGNDYQNDIAPCRAAEKSMTQCPRCNKIMTLKTMRYSHICGKTWNVTQRALEQQHAAQAALTARMESQRQQKEQVQSQQALGKERAEIQRTERLTKQTKYSHLLNF